VEVIFDTLKQTLIAGESVKVIGLRDLYRPKKERPCREKPQDKRRRFEITPRKVVTFKASDQLKEAIEKE